MFPLALFKPLCFLVPLLVIVRAEEAPEEFHFRLGDGPEQVAMTWVIVAILVLLSGLFSGLTLGLMGLDIHGLEMVVHGGNITMARYAEKILPVRLKGNLLLCTLLFGNVAINSLISILMADLTSGLIGFILSTVLIVFFGEIFPQAACARYALYIGSRSICVIKFIMVLLYPLARPVAFFLDWIMGEEIGAIHTRQELQKMMEIHIRHGEVDEEIGRTVAGALTLQDQVVESVMTPLQDIYMLPITETLSFGTLSAIFREGYARIPVYEEDRANIVGLLYVKDLIFVDPSDETPLRAFMKLFGKSVRVHPRDARLNKVLGCFKRGGGHMAVVADTDENGKINVKGIVTLKDVLEKILGDRFLNEKESSAITMGDVCAVHNREGVDTGRLRVWDTTVEDDNLTAEEVKAVASYLIGHVEPVYNLLASPERVQDAGSMLGLILENSVVLNLTASREPIYQLGKKSTVCTVILSGKIELEVGTSAIKSEKGPWSVLAVEALTSEEGSYIADFSAFAASDTVRCLQICQSVFSYVTQHYCPDKVHEIRNYFNMRRRRTDLSSGPFHSHHNQNQYQYPWFLQQTKEETNVLNGRVFMSVSSIDAFKEKSVVSCDSSSTSSTSMFSPPKSKDDFS